MEARQRTAEMEISTQIERLLSGGSTCTCYGTINSDFFVSLPTSCRYLCHYSAQSPYRSHGSLSVTGNRGDALIPGVPYNYAKYVNTRIYHIPAEYVTRTVGKADKTKRPEISLTQFN